MKRVLILATALLICLAAEAKNKRPDTGGIDASDITVRVTESAVRLEMTVRIDPNAVSKCQSAAVLPTLALSDGSRSVNLPYILVNGRKAKRIYERRSKSGYAELAENPPAEVVNLDRKFPGVTLYYQAEIPAADWHGRASLKLGVMIFSCAGECQYYAMETTAAMIVPPPRVIVQEIVPPPVPVEVKTELLVKGCADLDFRPDSYEIDGGYGRNAEELAAICRALDVVKNNPDAAITELSIVGYASPEDRYSKNEKLAYNRALSLAKYLQPIYGVPVRNSTVGSVAEDWDGLSELVEASDIPSKECVLEIINSGLHPDAKEAKLRRLAGGRPWKIMIDTMFPKLRRVEYKVSYTVKE